MIKSNRLKEMEAYIISKGVASMEELCRLYDISMNTCRNDVAELAKKGSILKVYGGVTSNVPSKKTNLVSIDERKTQNIQCKRDIAKAAACYVEQGDIIFIDSGSTAVNLLDFIDDKVKITIITHSVDVLMKASKLPNVELFCFGGRYQAATGCFVGMGIGNAFERYNINKAFMGTKGITETGAVTDSSMGEYEIKKWAVSRAKKSVLMADSRKFGRAGLMSYCNLEDVDVLVSDRMAPDGLVELCEQNNTELRLV